MPLLKKKKINKTVSTNKNKSISKITRKASSKKKLVRRVVSIKKRARKINKLKIPVFFENNQSNFESFVTIKKVVPKSKPVKRLLYFDFIVNLWLACTKPIMKIITYFLIVNLISFSFSSLEQTLAYFNDEELSLNNSFTATDLNITTDFIMSDGFRTQTQGAWGAEAHGNNSGTYRDANFSLAFPNGVNIGNDNGWIAHFASSTNVLNFLPAGGQPLAFSQNHENPINTEAGVLAGQALALTLNVGFDDYDPDFSINESKLRDFYANNNESPCHEMTVAAVLAEANNILAGQESDFSPSEINECLTEINEKFDNGLRQKISPTNSLLREITIYQAGSLNFQHNLGIEKIAGDDDFCQALNLKTYLNDNLIYTGSLLDFEYTPRLFSDVTNKWKLELSLGTDAGPELQEKNCQIKYLVSAWQENIISSSDGFNDREEIFDSIDSGVWGPIVINELFIPLNNKTNKAELKSKDTNLSSLKWVELYNKGEEDYDLTDWYFENSSGDILIIDENNSSLATTMIPAKTWLLVYLDDNFKLNEEKIILHNQRGNIIDFYNYVTSDDCVFEEINVNEKEENYKTFPLFCSASQNMKSAARMPDGGDDWLITIPTPGSDNFVTMEVLNSPIINDKLFTEDLFDYSCADNCPDILLPGDVGIEILAEPELIPSETEEVLPIDETIINEETAPASEANISEEPIIEEITPEPELEPALELVPAPEPFILPEVELVPASEPVVNNPEQDV